MPELSISGSVNYALDGTTINQPAVAVGSYLSNSIGTIDVPSGALSGASFAIPLGGVGNPIGFYLKSSVGTAVRVKFQGNPTGICLNDSGIFLYGNTRTPGNTPLSAIEVDLINAQTAPGTFLYEIFGD